MEGALLAVDGLCIDATDKNGHRKTIVQDISFTLRSGEVVALIGESGSGKTTICLAAMGYARSGCTISTGSVKLAGQEILHLTLDQRQRLRGAQVAYIAQSAAASFNAAHTINTQITEIPVLKGLMSPGQAKQRAIELYRQMDLPDPEHIGNKYPHQLSGGQLQRLMAAMAIICQPKLLMLDEPTTALDVTTQIEVLQTFKQLIRNSGTAAVYVSHDLAVVAQMADRIMVLKDGKIVEYQNTETLLEQPTQDYTQQLMAAVPTPPRQQLKQLAQTPLKQPHLLEVKQVSAHYGSELILNDVSMHVNVGQTLGVIGESGSGKSTLARVICGLLPPSSGAVSLDGESLPPALKDRQRPSLQRIQIAFQMADTALNPRQNVQKIITRPLQFYLDMSPAQCQDRAVELLELVDLDAHFLRRFPYQLYGGQKQRVNLARALAAEPDLIICDEVTSALDTIVARSVIELLKDLQNKLGLAYLFISHDLSTVASFADQIAVMQRGRIVDYGSALEVLTPPYLEYTELLLDSVPELRTDWLDGLGHNVS